MRAKNYLLVVLMFALFSPFISCKGADPEPDPDPYLRIEESSKIQTLESDARQIEVTVESNIDFTATSSGLWCKASVENNSLIIKVDENKDPIKREAKVTLTGGDKVTPIEITVRQGGVAPYIMVSPESVTVDFTILKFDLEITTNIDIEFDIQGSWIKRSSAATRSTAKTYSFTLETANEQTLGKIVIRGKDSHSEISAECVVRQVEGNDVAPKFAVISDTHFKTEGTEAQEKVSRTLELLIAKSPDAIFVAGDITNDGYDAQYKKLIETFQMVPTTIPVYYMMGNHDCYNNVDGGVFKSNMNQELNQYIIIKGHPFITISQNARKNSGSGIYGSGAKEFLTEKLADAAANYPNKPIFVFYHTPLENTCYGSNGWGSSDLAAILNRYPQVVAFSGHSHFPLGDERSIHQNIFTSVNLGSQTYSELEANYGFSEGIHPANYKLVTEAVIVTPSDNQALKDQGKYYKNFTLERWDTYRNEEIKEPWEVKAPHNGTQFTYKNRSGSVHSFDASAKPVVSNITINECTVAWPQAKSANTFDKVHHYEVAVKEGSSVAVTYKVFSQFYLNSDMPQTLSWNISGLKDRTKYKIEIKAIDSWYTNKSTPIVSAEFTTLAYVPDVDIEVPVADVFDVAFTSAGAVDYSVMNSAVTAGPTIPVLSYNSSLKMFMSTYVNDKNSFHRLDYKGNEAFKASLAGAFSLEVFYKTLDNREISPVGAMQAGGIGIEQTKDGGDTRLWVDLGTGYSKIGITKTNNTDYYHMVFTFDGSKLTAYTNGVLVAELAVKGKIKFPADDKAHWFAFGGDANTAGDCQGSLAGDVVFSRLYGTGLSRDEVAKLYGQTGDRAEMTTVDDLNIALSVTLPGKGNPVELVAEGWALMNNLSTTDAQITAFLARIL